MLASPKECRATVLMIEDEEPLRYAVAKLLRAKGLSVLEAGDGKAALELSRSHASKIDITVLDVTLPGLSGKEVLQKLREMEPSLKVIITSAYGRAHIPALHTKAVSRG
jgi:CheY-like chemotaxis protein